MNLLLLFSALLSTLTGIGQSAQAPTAVATISPNVAAVVRVVRRKAIEPSVRMIQPLPTLAEIARQAPRLFMVVGVGTSVDAIRRRE